MTRFTSQATALFAAVVMTVVSLNAIVTIPPAESVAIVAPALA